MSKELKQFLMDWYRWATREVVEPTKEFSFHGLCTNLQNWLFHNYGDKFKVRHTVTNEFHKLLQADFGENVVYPFNGANLDNRAYVLECRGMCSHKNPERLAWVRKQLES